MGEQEEQIKYLEDRVKEYKKIKLSSSRQKIQTTEG